MHTKILGDNWFKYYILYNLWIITWCHRFIDWAFHWLTYYVRFGPQMKLPPRNFEIPVPFPETSLHGSYFRNIHLKPSRTAELLTTWPSTLRIHLRVIWTFTWRQQIHLLICRANGSSYGYAVVIDSNPPMNFMTDVGSTKEAADDPWKLGLLGWLTFEMWVSLLLWWFTCFTHLSEEEDTLIFGVQFN